MSEIQDEAYSEAMEQIERLRSIMIGLLGDVMATQKYYPSERREKLIESAQKEVRKQL